MDRFPVEHIRGDDNAPRLDNGCVAFKASEKGGFQLGLKRAYGVPKEIVDGADLQTLVFDARSDLVDRCIGIGDTRDLGHWIKSKQTADDLNQRIGFAAASDSTEHEVPARPYVIKNRNDLGFEP